MDYCSILYIMLNLRESILVISTQYRSWLGELCFSSYMVAVALFLTTNAVEMVLFFVPAIHKYNRGLELSDIPKYFPGGHSQDHMLDVGCKKPKFSVLKYTAFWVLVLLTKFLFSYSF
ncbi:hypothetical protein NC651_027750 [Populus alba x Populus x berolinensis]|nr:hypothetical protein NC651_027750 [Populus alba x Populus x berolinensis]